MKKKASAAETWDDLVFEHRHKDYGAYAVRQHYTQNMTTGLGVSVSMACLLVVLPKILSMFGVDEKILPAIPKDLDKIIEINTAPLIDVPLVTPPPPAVARTQPQNSNVVTPKVTTTASDDATITPNNEIVISNSTAGTGEGQSIEGVAGGTGSVETETLIITPPTIFEVAEVMPIYEGGLKALAQFIQRKVRTPRSVSTQNVSGTVYVQFVVRSDGRITDVVVVKGVAEDCDREAMRLVSMMKGWSPGLQNHQPVSVRMVLPIKFQSQEL